MGNHTVEKIGGTSMSDFQSVARNIILHDEKNLYNRVFVVSAYGGVTDKLLEHKKTGEPGVYALFANDDADTAWSEALSTLSADLCKINESFFENNIALEQANRFITERIEGVRSCLHDLQRLCSYGHFNLESHLMTVREMLSAIGEAHSAYNMAHLLRDMKVNARFIDLSGWRENESLTLKEKIRKSFAGIDYANELLIVTGYTHCSEGLMSTYDRGYSEITFSTIAVETQAKEAIIHKEYHLSSADPKLVGEGKVVPIGRTNYDVADQLSAIGMEAIHPKAAKGMRQVGIPLRIKNTFEPDHYGTAINSDYRSESPRVEIIAGCHVTAIQLFDQDMVGEKNYENFFLDTIHRFGAKVSGKDLNANCIVHYLDCNLKTAKRIEEALMAEYPHAEVEIRRVAMVCTLGSDLKVTGLLADAVSAMSERDINILAVHQTPRQVDIRFIVEESDYEETIRALHAALIETHNHQYAISGAM
jgi:aspartate kinase